MKNKLKRLIALILAMSMCLSLLSANVWAAEESDPLVDEGVSAQSSEGVGSAEEAEKETEQTKDTSADGGTESAENPDGEHEESDSLVDEQASAQSSEGVGSAEGPEKEPDQVEETSYDGETESAGNSAEEPKASEQELEVQATKSGKCGKNLTWTLDGKGTLTIHGKGEMTNYNLKNNPPWQGYLSTIKKVVIESGVTSIGAYAFDSEDEKTRPKKFEEVIIPGSVTSIGESAFFGCVSLKNVIIPNGMTFIGEGAFYGCSKMTSVSLPDTVTTIGEEAFSACGIKHLQISSNVKKMGRYAFADCYNLEQVVFTEGSTLIGEGAFCGCEKLKSVTVPNSLRTVKKDAFLECSKLTNITIPRGVTSIEKHAFGYQFDEDENYILIKGFSIAGYAGSTAESYAKNNKIKFVTKKYAPSVNGWGFGNYRETISEEVFYRVFDRSKLVNKILYLKKKDKEHALCQGMAFTSALSFIGNPAISSWGKLSANCEHDFKYTDKYNRTSSEINMTLNEYVQAMWLYQFSKEAQSQESKNKNKYYEIIEKTENFYRTGKNPIVVIIKGTGSGTVQIVGHILVPYRVERKENEIRLYVYDCNKYEEDVADSQYITLKKDDSGVVSKWEYDLGGGRIWQSSSLDKLNLLVYMSYIDCFTEFPSVLESSGIDSGENGLLCTDSEIFSVTNEKGKTITYNNGKMIGNENYDVIPITDFCSDEEESDKLFYMNPGRKLSVENDTNHDITSIIAQNDDCLTFQAGGKSLFDVSYSDSGIQAQIHSDSNYNETVVFESQNYSVPITICTSDANTVAVVIDKRHNTIKVDADFGEIRISEGDSKTYVVNGKKGSAEIDLTQYVVAAKKKNSISGVTSIKKTVNVKKNQSFNLNANANGAKLSYKSNNKNVTVKNGKVTIKKGFVGRATITITSAATDKYLSATKKVTVTVNPSTTQISSVKWDKKKKVVNVAWKKNTTGKGYELQSSTNKNFKKNVKTWKIKDKKIVKATIKGLKKGTYYLHIRTVNGKCYSKWSKTKTTKISK